MSSHSESKMYRPRQSVCHIGDRAVPVEGRPVIDVLEADNAACELVALAVAEVDNVASAQVVAVAPEADNAAWGPVASAVAVEVIEANSVGVVEVVTVTVDSAGFADIVAAVTVTSVVVPGQSYNRERD